MRYHPVEHADAGPGDFSTHVRRPTADDKGQHIWEDESGLAKFASGYNEFGQFFIEDLTQSKDFIRMNEGEGAPTFDAGINMPGGNLNVGNNPIRGLQQLSNTASTDLDGGEFVFDDDRGGTGNGAWLFKDSNEAVRYWDADETL